MTLPNEPNCWIVCAHNEATTIGPVVAAIRAADLGPVLVVADRCHDATADIAHREGAAVLEAAAGDKGSAMQLGLVHTDAPRVGFIDADLIGLEPGHLRQLAAYPGTMTVGIRDGSRRFEQFPSIGGERTLPREVARLAGLWRSGYEAEMRLATAAERLRVPVCEVRLYGLQHPTRLEPWRVSSRWRGVWTGYQDYRRITAWRRASGRLPPYAALD